MASKGAEDHAGRWRELLAGERDAVALYSRIAAAETGERREIFEQLAAVERRHAAHWEGKLRAAGAPVPPPGRPSLRTRLIAAAAGRFSTGRVLPLIERAERADAGIYDNEPDAAPGMAADEHGHARTIAKLIDGGRPDPRQRIARRERWHRTDRSGALRAGVFGVSAGLLAGAFSMAAGEYVSMASQREMYEHEIALEAAELEEKPEEERDELALLYRAKGLDRADAQRLAGQIMSDRKVALDTLAREELGLDPGELGSPLSAAISSLFTFASGALVVILPYFFGGGTAALVAAIVLAIAALLAVGGGIGLLNGRPLARSALRQLVLGGAAALVTFGIGRLIGATVS